MLKKFTELFKTNNRISQSSSKGYIAFDLEITKAIPEDATDWNIFRPFGISCAATLTSDGVQKLWFGENEKGEMADQMSVDEIVDLIGYLSTEVIAGKTIVTWNGLGFDFDILAEESGLHDACRNLALGHIDMMFHLFCQKGFPLALDKAAKGMGLPGKPEYINGSLVSKFWAEGRREDVFDYVAQDVKTTLGLFLITEKRGELCWQSNRGLPQTLPLPKGWLTVPDALKLPLPDTSWMSNPWPRSKFTDWLTEPARRPKPVNKDKSRTRGYEKTFFSRKSLTKEHTHVFQRVPVWWWKIKMPTDKEELAISDFLKNAHTNSLYGLAMREIALTFAGTNIRNKDGKTILETDASVEEIEAILRDMPQNMIMEIWYAVGKSCPGWGPDVSASPEECNDILDSEASVGLGDYVPEYDDDFRDYDF